MINNAAPDLRTAIITPILCGTLLLYGSGPGLIVGAVSVPYFTTCLIVNKICLLWNQKRLQYAHDPEKKQLLKVSIKHLHTRISENLYYTKLFMLGAVPGAGGVIAMCYIRPQGYELLEGSDA